MLLTCCYLHFILALVHAIRKSCSGGLVDHSQNIQASDLTSIFCCLEDNYGSQLELTNKTNKLFICLTSTNKIT